MFKLGAKKPTLKSNMAFFHDLLFSSPSSSRKTPPLMQEKSMELNPEDGFTLDSFGTRVTSKHANEGESVGGFFSEI